jgi:deoxyinosine 3'endonuclease (endonuclease V)
MGKLKYGLKKSMQKETQRIVSFDVSYDHDEDDLYVGMAVRKDAYNAELLERVQTAIEIALELVSKDNSEGIIAKGKVTKATKEILEFDN